MSRDEVITILGILRIAYPRFYANMTSNQAEETISLWQEMFADDDCNVVKLAVKNLINTFQFPPTIADVKNELYKLYAGEKKTDIELWNELKSAIRGGIYYSAEIFPTLSEELQLYLKNPMQLKELAMSDIEEIDTVQKGIFLKQMPIIRERQKEKMMMLPSTRKFISELANKLDANRLLGGDNDDRS